MRSGTGFAAVATADTEGPHHGNERNAGFKFAEATTSDETNEIRRLLHVPRSQPDAGRGGRNHKAALNQVLGILERHHHVVREHRLAARRRTARSRSSRPKGRPSERPTRSFGSARASPDASSRAASRSSCRGCRASRCSCAARRNGPSWRAKRSATSACRFC